MNKFWIICFHTFLTKLKSKSFIITTIVMLGLLLLSTNINKIIDLFDKNANQKIAIIDETGQLFKPFQRQVKVLNKDLKLTDYKNSEDQAVKEIEKGKYKAVVKLSINSDKLPEGSYKAMTIADESDFTNLQTALQQLRTSVAASQINLSAAQLQKLYNPVVFKKTALEKNAKTAEQLDQARGLVYVLLFVIYIAVIMYANMIATEVATEKSSRVMEILVSSVSPIKQMFGKIVGVALLSFSQLALFIIVGYLSYKSNKDSMQGGISKFLGFDHIPASTIAYAVIFLMLGYFLYSTLAALLGSLVSRVEDVQQMVTPMTMLIMIGFFIAAFGLGTPDSKFITVTSFIPFFSPMIMFLRVGMLTIPVWQTALSIGILVGTIAILAIFGARVYKGGVLMYGNASSFKDIKKALQLTKNE